MDTRYKDLGDKCKIEAVVKDAPELNSRGAFSIPVKVEKVEIPSGIDIFEELEEVLRTLERIEPKGNGFVVPIYRGDRIRAYVPATAPHNAVYEVPDSVERHADGHTSVFAIELLDEQGEVKAKYNLGSLGYVSRGPWVPQIGV